MQNLKLSFKSFFEVLFKNPIKKPLNVGLEFFV